MNVLVDRTTVQNRLRAVISMEVSLVPAIQVSPEMELPVSVSPHLRLSSACILLYNIFLDIDECTIIGLDDCDETANFECVNIPGSFNCVCSPGYEMDGGGNCVGQ